MEDRVRLAPVGLGRWARVLARGAQRGDVVELVSCFSRDEARRTAFQDEFGIARGAASYEELLGDPEVEGVIVTTPNDTHRDVIVQALEAGKAVYTDKPIAHTLEHANAIAAAARDVGGVFAVGHSARRLSGHREMARWVADGRLGDVSLVEANFSNERGLELTPDTWRFFAAKSPGGAFIQLGVHHADTLQALLGPIRTVSAHVRRLFTKAEVPDAVMAICEFESGALGYLGTGWASPGVYRMSVLGTKAALNYDLDFTKWDESHLADDWSRLEAQYYGQSERETLDLPRTDMFREQLDEFALAIRGQAEVEVGADEAVRALAVVHAALLSSERAGAAVPLAEVIEAAGKG
ncbi:MAG: gfo/Idh/MocA family oxidoreductase [Streptosporangiales bacterium]|nr:gfo/Idh/MocA family oxidoreductase [Streptosporangiales bacterium]